ncbi:alcohol dehydrogenase superfamily, zinc-containing [Luminiphilus syltensis NOR5-1B]|uniref:Alcohol dehydrogenase superfamily, zinc-containing n=2 Tax=Luminiphilus TaxID=1341118 RepID=B8KVD4_9GAMM|nr:alcohol dehydrogenase superfamily, zinc-containing [Luminiphilus syltensis NOR5-1B]
MKLKNPASLDNLWLDEVTPRAPGPGEIQVAIKASSLNFHDYAVVAGMIPVEDGRVPMSDGAGEVLAIGDGVTEFSVGDGVLSYFFPKWVSGRPVASRLLGVPGDHVDGFASQVVTMPASWFSRMPSNLDFAAASTLTCAGLTAWRALMVETKLAPGDWVLVQGSGGVSVFALQLARAMGCRVIATSSSNEKLAKLGVLGAEVLINYREDPNWGNAALEATGGEGVSLVVEVGGPGNLPQSVRAIAFDGCISLIGILTGISGDVPTAALMQKNARISGITVGSQSDQAALIKAVEAHDIQPVIDRHFPLAELKAAFEFQASQQHFGKICVSF